MRANPNPNPNPNPHPNPNPNSNPSPNPSPTPDPNKVAALKSSPAIWQVITLLVSELRTLFRS